MNQYVVYAQMGNQPEKEIARFATEEAAIAFILRYLERTPAATCYINNGTVGWVK